MVRTNHQTPSLSKVTPLPSPARHTHHTYILRTHAFSSHHHHHHYHYSHSSVIPLLPSQIDRLSISRSMVPIRPVHFRRSSPLVFFFIHHAPRSCDRPEISIAARTLAPRLRSMTFMNHGGWYGDRQPRGCPPIPVSRLDEHTNHHK